MKVSDIYERSAGPVLSIEVIPPRNGGNIQTVYDCVEAVREFHPAFISVTYGSGGSLRGGTAAIAALIRERYGIESVAHLTCVGSSRQDIENILMDFHYLGIENLLALRGDPPEGGDGVFRPAADGHRYASDLAAQIRDLNAGRYLIRDNDYTFGGLPQDATFRPGAPTKFCVGGAGYPEGHIECPDRVQDLAHLKIKLEAGVSYILTQMIFQTDFYERFLTETREQGIAVPIVPGIMPLTGFKQINYVENVFKPTIPAALKRDLEAHQDDREAMREISVEFTVHFCRELLAAGAPGLHFYTMNRGRLLRRILSRLVEEELLPAAPQLHMALD